MESRQILGDQQAIEGAGLNRTCDICANEVGNRTHQAREMMFGWRDLFTYLECSACGCLQNRSVPADLGRYYGPNYYSVTPSTSARRPVYEAIKAARTRAYLQGANVIGRALLRAFGAPGLPEWARRAGMRQDSNILEIGCGSGQLLLTMRSEGFTRLTGADPFIEREIDHGGGLKILKRHISELSGTFDFIVLEHAFEHIPDQRAVMSALLGLLAPRGTLIVSIPLAHEAWQRYGVDWVQLDAPRHLYLHTERSFRLLCRGLQVFEVVYDSGAVQFWGSEQYRQNIALLDPRSARVDASAPLFTKAQMEGFTAEAEGLNASGQGDQATFYLRAA